MTRLRISENLSLPLELVTESVAILAIKRAGKSYTARKLAEQLYRAGQQVVIVDPKGDWWGIRSAANGRDPGLPIVILGGEHGDVALEVGSGELVANLVVRDRVSILLDLASFRKHQVSTFMTDFLETVYRLKAKDEYRTPMMLIIDEADAIAPQRPFKGEERMLGAAEDIVRRGGQRGIGITCVTQRAAVLNKNLLTQCGILIFLRTLGLQDIEGVNEWIKKHGQPEQKDLLMAELASLPRGTAWVWAPGWPDERGIFKRVEIDRIDTFDSGATPKPGEKRIAPKTLADVDLDAFSREMAATIERAKAEDPRELRKKISALERELKARPKEQVEKTVEKIVEVPVLKGESLERLETLHRGLTDLTDRVTEALYKMAEEIRKAAQRPAVTSPVPKRSPAPIAIARPRRVPRLNANPPADPEGAEVGTGGLRRILVALADRPNGLSIRQLGVRSQMKTSGGSFQTYISRARSQGWIEGDRNLFRITDAGIAALGDYEPAPTGQALYELWVSQLPKTPAQILKLLYESPRPLSKEEIAEAVGMEVSGGSFQTYISRLRSLELVEGRAELRASEELFG